MSDIDTEFAWEGLFAMTPDTLPYIGPHRRYPRQWFVLGYGGNGMTFGFLAARLLLERWRRSMVRLAKERHAPPCHDAAHLEVRKRDVGHRFEQDSLLGLRDEVSRDSGSLEGDRARSDVATRP
jgi:hypothetical protein